MKAYLLSFQFPGKSQVFYKLVHAFTYEHAKEILLVDFKNKGTGEPSSISNETLEYTI